MPAQVMVGRSGMVMFGRLDLCTVCRFVVLALLFASVGCQAESRNPEIHIQVEGKRNESIEISTVWSANGSYWDDDGNFLEPTDENLPEIWDDEGEMAPLPTRKLLQSGDGMFVLSRPTKNLATLFAIDKDSKKGALAFITKATKNQLHLSLKPLVRVSGKLVCDNSIPEWTHVYIYSRDAPESPD